MLKPEKYSAEAYAKSLAKAHKSGHMPQKLDEVPLHRQVGMPVRETDFQHKHKHRH